MSKETLLNDLRNTGGKLDSISWLHYARIHDIKEGTEYTDEQRAKAANDIWRGFLNKSIEKEVELLKSTSSSEELIGFNAPKELIEWLNFKNEETALEKTWNETKDNATLTLTTPNEVKNVPELINACGIDSKIWEAESFWQSNKSNKWNISVNFKKRKIDEDLHLQKELILGELKDASIPFASFPRNFAFSKSSAKDNLLELSLFDLHIGKLAWDEETGESYDSKIACERFETAIVDLLSRTDVSSIDRILFPIGNDMINVDNNMHTTTAGTPQYCDSRFSKMLKVAKELLIDTIMKLSIIAPVDVIVVPGNHDNLTMFTLGEVIDAYFHNNSNVNVLNSPKQRKYYQYGVNGLMFSHGNSEKHADLGLIFATEEPKLWAETKYREAHLGHFHKVKSTKYLDINEETGFKVRVLPSLSGTDAWHYSKGYISNKSAEAYLWNKTKGLLATYIHNA